jgi:putative membrane protein
MIGQLLVAVVALIHTAIVLAEMVFWETPVSAAPSGCPRTWRQGRGCWQPIRGSKTGSLWAGLVWSVYAGLPGEGAPITHFFLSCVLVAGLYGAATVSHRILLVQALPAALTLGAVLGGV